MNDNGTPNEYLKIASSIYNHQGNIDKTMGLLSNSTAKSESKKIAQESRHFSIARFGFTLTKTIDAWGMHPARHRAKLLAVAKESSRSPETFSDITFRKGSDSA